MPHKNDRVSILGPSRMFTMAAKLFGEGIELRWSFQVSCVYARDKIGKRHCHNKDKIRQTVLRSLIPVAWKGDRIRQAPTPSICLHTSYPHQAPLLLFPHPIAPSPHCCSSLTPFTLLAPDPQLQHTQLHLLAAQ